MNTVRNYSHLSYGNNSEDYLLTRALDRGYMDQEFQNVSSDTWNGARVVSVQSAELVRRKPSRRCLIKYDVILDQGSKTRTLSLLGKLRTRSFDSRTYRLTTLLWKSGFGSDSSDGIFVPEPIGALPNLNMWLQRTVEADPLATVINSLGGSGYCADAGYALGKLHSLGPDTDRRHELSDELDTLSKRLRCVCSSTPRYASRIRRVLIACYDLAKMIPDCETVGIHRDFYQDQILSRPSATWLLDLDLYAQGDPALDLGNFIAHLQEFSLRQFGHTRAYAHHEHAFLDAYAKSTGRDNCRFSAAAYTTLTLARHLAISRTFPERRNITSKLLSLCEHRLSMHGSALRAGLLHRPVKS